MLGRMIVVFAVVLGLMFSGYVIAADPPGKGAPQTICPVDGGENRQKRLHGLPGQAHLLLLQRMYR